MSDFLSNLLARSFADAPAIQPRVPSLFERAVDEFFDERQSPTPTIAAHEMIAPAQPIPMDETHKTIPHKDAPAPVPKLSPIEKTVTTRLTANVSEATAEEHPLNRDAPVHEKAPVSAQAAQSREEVAERKKLEVETKKVIVPVDSSRAGKIDADDRNPPSKTFSEVRPIQPRRRKDVLPVERRYSKSAPVIRVTIGRIEVRAVHQPAAAPKSAKPAPRKLSLDEYLKGGKR